MQSMVRAHRRAGTPSILSITLTPYYIRPEVVL